MEETYQVSLSTNGREQVLTIPHELALQGTEVTVQKQGQQLIVEAVLPKSLLALLATLPEITDEFPDIK